MQSDLKEGREESMGTECSGKADSGCKGPESRMHLMC